MSTHYHVFCKTCGVRCETPRTRNTESPLRELIQAAPAIVACYRALKPLNETEMTVQSSCATYRHVDLDWLDEHVAHDMAIIDEYGEVTS